MNVLTTLQHSEPLALCPKHNINARWPSPRFDTFNLVRNCSDIAGIEQQLRDALRVHTPPPQVRAPRARWHYGSHLASP